MTIGDVFSVVAAILGIFLTSWATVVGVALLMPNAAERSRTALEQPKRALWRGAAVLIPAAVIGVVLLSIPAPLVKMVGWVLTLGWMALCAVGASGLAQAAGRRIQDLDPSMGAYAALCRGAAFVVGAGILPLLGWFAFGPLLIVASVGAGWSAVMSSGARSGAGEAV